MLDAQQAVAMPEIGAGFALPQSLIDLAAVADGTIRLSKARRAFRNWKAAFKRYGL